MTVASGLTTAAITSAMVAAVAGAPTSGAVDEPTVDRLGDQISLVDGSGVQGWTVGALARSTDTIAFPVQGTLWEATATDEALQGNVVVPIVSNFNARTPNGLSYRALFQVPTALGVNPSPLAQGQETSGKIYFDVTGDGPDSVVYNAGGRDLLVWMQPAADNMKTRADNGTAPTGAGMVPGRAGTGSAAPSTGGQTESLPVGDSPAAPLAALMPAGVQPPVSPPPGWQGTPVVPAGPPMAPANTPPVPASLDTAASVPPSGWVGTPLAPSAAPSAAPQDAPPAERQGTRLPPDTASAAVGLINIPPAPSPPDATATIPPPGWQGTPLPADGVLPQTEPAPAVAP